MPTSTPKTKSTSAKPTALSCYEVDIVQGEGGRFQVRLHLCGSWYNIDGPVWLREAKMRAEMLRVGLDRIVRDHREPVSIER